MTGWLPEVGEMLGCWQACRSRVGSEIGRRDLGGREGLGGLRRGLRTLRREGEVGTRDGAVGEDRTGARGGGSGPVARWGRCGRPRSSRDGVEVGVEVGSRWEVGSRSEVGSRFDRGPRIKSSGVWNF